MTKLLLRLAFLLLTPLVIALLVFFYLRSNLIQAVDPSNSQPVIIEVPDQTDIAGVAKILHEAGLIRTTWSIDVLSRLSSDSANIVYGEYELNRTLTPRQILEKLRSGEVVKRPITIREGFTIWDVATVFEEAGIRDRATVLAALVNPELLMRAGINNSNFEGYLYPGNYQFSKTESMPQIIWKMMETGENAWDPSFTDRADELKLSRHEVITLASLLQAETDNPDYQMAISGVMHNRLTNLMRLESIPALRYGIGNTEEELTEEDYQNDKNLYNTFVHYGLPPGPICSPGEQALNSALNFQNHQFLFYLADGSGGFRFAETLNEYVALKQKLEK